MHNIPHSGTSSPLLFLILGIYGLVGVGTTPNRINLVLLRSYYKGGGGKVLSIFIQLSHRVSS